MNQPQTIGHAHHLPHGWYMLRVSTGEFRVFDNRGNITASLLKTMWGKWKIAGEDTYAWTPEELVERLQRRAGWTKP